VIAGNCSYLLGQIMNKEIFNDIFIFYAQYLDYAEMVSAKLLTPEKKLAKQYF
jgi:predicted nucleic acid-binding protein